MKSILLAIVIFSSMSMAAVGREPMLTVSRSSNGEGTVGGEPVRVLQFFLIWQHSVWPEWATCATAVKMNMEHIYGSKDGQLVFDIKAEINAKAFDIAEKETFASIKRTHGN